MFIVSLYVHGSDVCIRFSTCGPVALYDFLFADTRRYDSLTVALWSLMPDPHRSALDILADIESRSPLVVNGPSATVLRSQTRARDCKQVHRSARRFHRLTTQCLHREAGVGGIWSGVRRVSG